MFHAHTLSELIESLALGAMLLGLPAALVSIVALSIP